MLRLCQSIRTSSLPDKENQAIFAARSPTAIRNIRLLSLRPRQIPETSRSGTWTTRRTRSRFFFDLRFLPSERLSAGMKGTLQPLADDFSRFRSPLAVSRVHWVRPELVAEVRFLTWTEDNLLRQVVYEGLREDKPARAVRREIPHPKRGAGEDAASVRPSGRR